MSKLETMVVQGDTVAPAKPQRGPTTEDPRDEWGFLEEVARNLKPVNGKVTTIPVPLEAVVGQDGIDWFKSALRSGEFPVTAEIVAVHGRCVEARAIGASMPSWPHLAPALLGCGSPCEDFQVVNGRLYATLKTSAQQEADRQARSFDEFMRAQTPHSANEFDYEGLYQFCTSVIEEKPTAAKAAARSKRKKKIPEGAAQFVMKMMEQTWPHHDAVEIEELIVAVEKIMPPKLDGNGKNRTARYISRAIDTLVARGVLYLHSGSQVSLYEE